MNILSVNTFFPCPPRRGMDLIYLNLLKLQSTKHSVTVVTLCRSGEEERHLAELSAWCDRVVLVRPRNAGSFLAKAWRRCLYSTLSWLQWRPRPSYYGATPELRSVVRDLVGQGRFDLVEIHHSTSAGLRREAGPGPCALYLYDLHFRSRERLAATTRGVEKIAASVEASKFRRFEAAMVPRFDLLLLGQEQDKAVVESWHTGARVVALMPNVIDTDSVTPRNCYPPGSRVAVFVGAMTHQANVDAVLNFFRGAWMRIRGEVPDAQWWIVGGAPPPEIRDLHGRDGVSVHADVPDVAPFVAAASVYVAPLRIGSGVKVKMMEALALGKAIVATGVAAEGMGLVSGRDLEIAELDGPFADAVVRLWSDDQHRTRLEQGARETAVNRFGVEAGRRVMDAVYAGMRDDDAR